MALYLTARQVAERWGCSTRQVQRLCHSGALRAMRLGLESWRIRLADVETYELAKANRPAEGPSSARPDEPIRPVFGAVGEGARRPLGERWWERETNDAASSAAGRGRATGKEKRPSAVTKRR